MKNFWQHFTRNRVTTAMELIGFGLISVGIGLFSVPFALVVAGILLIIGGMVAA